MIRSYTAAEIRLLWRLTCDMQVIYKFAHEQGWRKIEDKRRPVLYDADDVDATMHILAARQRALLDARDQHGR